MPYCKYDCADLDNAVILSRDASQCVINKLGCTITSWRIEEVEQLFVSSLSKYQQHNAISGGIGYCFPKIGDWLTGPTSGFAKLCRWEVIRRPYTNEERDINVLLHLVSNAYTRSFWNFNFEIVNHIILKEQSIQIRTTIRNTDALLPLRFNFLYATYFQTEGLDNIKIRGLHGVPFMEKRTTDKSVYVEKKKTLFVKNYIYRLYSNISNRIDVDYNSSESVLRLAHKDIEDFVIWNPGPSEEEQVVVNCWGKGFNPKQYNEMIFFGFGNVLKEKRLLPREECQYGVEIERWSNDIYSDVLF